MIWKKGDLVGQFDSHHHQHMASYSGDSGQWKEQDAAAKSIDIHLQTINSGTEHNMSCWGLTNYLYCGTHLMQFDMAKPFNFMLKCAQQYSVNIYVEQGILLIHCMLPIMRENSN